MRGIWKTRLGVGLLALVSLMGCNPLLLTAYLFNKSDPRMPAEYPLKPQPKREKEEIKVVVLTSCVPGLSPDMIGVDRLLAAEFIPLLEKRCIENEEKVIVFKSSPIDAYKRDNPDWRRQSPYDIGKHLDANYVIDLEVLKIDLYEPGTRQELLKGRATVAVSCYDLSKKLKDPDFNPPEFNFEYPRGHEVPKSDVPLSTFRQKFVRRMAQELVLPFTAHTSNQKVNID